MRRAILFILPSLSACLALDACETPAPQPPAASFVAARSWGADPGAAGVVPLSCLGPGQPVGRGIWPGADNSSPVLLPPGCAVDQAIAAQVTAPNDLLRGRKLPPGPSWPYAQATERYEHRNDGASGQEGSGGRGSGGSPTPLAQPETGPLQGPLQAGPLPAQKTGPSTP